MSVCCLKRAMRGPKAHDLPIGVSRVASLLTVESFMAPIQDYRLQSLNQGFCISNTNKMKKFILYITGCLLLTSCGIEFSDNGKLDGFWQLMSADTLTNQHTLDLKTSGRTWAFQGLKVTDIREVSPYGVNGLSEGFVVESLSNDKMILRSKTLRLRLRKI